MDNWNEWFCETLDLDMHDSYISERDSLLYRSVYDQ